MRPEDTAPPELFYNKDEATKYVVNTRMRNIQTQMTERAIDMLNLPADRHSLILDVGCGSGMSSEVLSDHGHTWIGLDISRSMLEAAAQEGADGELIENDMGQGFTFRAGTFDGCISISALQWLCNADKKGVDPYKRLRAFFQSLYNCMKTGSRAALQFYPENAQQLEMITSAATRSGFGGGLIVDYPNSTKAKKFYLVLYAGFTTDQQALPKALGEEGEEKQTSVKVFGKTNQKVKRVEEKKKPVHKSRQWILEKKQRMSQLGVKTANDSKYSGRSRGPRF